MAAGDDMFSSYGRILVLLSGPPDPTPWSQFVQRAAPLNLAIDCFCIGTKDFRLEELVCVTELGGHVLMQKDVDPELGNNLIQVWQGLTTGGAEHPGLFRSHRGPRPGPLGGLSYWPGLCFR